jgi:CDP-4-dehydro-6-deoxyglucose reductase
LSDSKFVKPWHGIPREKIKWHPIVDEDACIGCGTCVTGCGRLVYRFDYESKKAVVADPLNCMVGCVTCANTCPTKAISFPPLDEISSLLFKPETHHSIEEELLSRKEQLQWRDVIPHNNRIVSMIVDRISNVKKDIIVVTLKPKTKQIDCFCQFIPGQYVEVWIPETIWLSRAYSIGNSPREDGSIELQVHRVDGGKFSSWAFEKMKIGDTVSIRGPLGSFTLASERDKSIIFVAGGTGFAPIKSMIEQLFKITPDRKNIFLFWGAHDSDGFYELDEIDSWIRDNANFKCILATKNLLSNFVAPQRIDVINKSLHEALDGDYNLSGYDAYVAGTPLMIPSVIKSLISKGIKHERIKTDSFGGE